MRTFLLAVLVFFLAGCQPAPGKISSEIRLTDQEQFYLNRHPTLRYAAETKHPPYIFSDRNKPRGMSQDYLELVAARLNIKLEPVFFSTFVDGMAALRSRELDLLTTVRRTDTRVLYLELSPPYSLVGGVFVTRPGTLITRKIGIGKGYAVKEWVEKTYPTNTVVEFLSDSESIKALGAGAIDGAAMDLASYLWDKPLSDVPLSATPIAFDYPYHFAVLKDNRELSTLIAKAMLTITPEERASINKRWVKESKESSTIELP